jgi:hypothetical protein
VITLVISIGHTSNDMTALLDHMRDPPYKIRHMKVLGYIILISFPRVSLLEIYQAFSTCCPVFPFKA